MELGWGEFLLHRPEHAPPSLQSLPKAITLRPIPKPCHSPGQDLSLALPSLLGLAGAPWACWRGSVILWRKWSRKSPSLCFALNGGLLPWCLWVSGNLSLWALPAKSSCVGCVPLGVPGNFSSGLWVQVQVMLQLLSIACATGLRFPGLGPSIPSGCKKPLKQGCNFCRCQVCLMHCKMPPAEAAFRRSVMEPGGVHGLGSICTSLVKLHLQGTFAVHLSPAGVSPAEGREKSGVRKALVRFKNY